MKPNFHVQYIPCGICGGCCSTETRFSPTASGFPFQHHSPSVPYSYLTHVQSTPCNLSNRVHPKAKHFSLSLSTSNKHYSKSHCCGDNLNNLRLTFTHRASCILGQAFHYSPENAFYIFNQQIYFII